MEKKVKTSKVIGAVIGSLVALAAKTAVVTVMAISVLRLMHVAI